MSRNVWTNEEVAYLLEVMKEKQIIKHMDGKKYKSLDLYKVKLKEMLSAGFKTKSAKQIKIKWKSLKASYVKVRKENSVSGASRRECPYFDELDNLLNTRPSSIVPEVGIDSASAATSQSMTEPFIEISIVENLNESDLQEIVDMDADLFPANAATSTPRTSSTTASAKPYRKNMNLFLEDWKKIQDELQESFFKQQRELVHYQFDLQRKMEKEICEHESTGHEKNHSMMVQSMNRSISFMSKQASPSHNFMQHTSTSSKSHSQPNITNTQPSSDFSYLPQNTHQFHSYPIWHDPTQTSQQALEDDYDDST